MELFVLLVALLLSMHTGRTVHRVVGALTGYQSWLVFCLSVFAGYSVCEDVYGEYAGNPLALVGIVIATEVGLLFVDALIRRFAPHVLAAEAAEARRADDEFEEDEADDDDDWDEEEEDEAYNHEEDPDYVDARTTAERLLAQIEGTEWKEARKLANQLLNEALPELLTLRNELAFDLAAIDGKLKNLEDGPTAAKRRTGLEEDRARTLAMHANVDEAVHDAKGTLERLLVLARERRVGTRPDAIGESTRLLTETYVNNQALLAARREVELVGRR